MQNSFYRKEELEGKLVYDQRAAKVGIVRDVGYSKDGQAALLIERGGEESYVSFTMIQEIGEIVLLKPEAHIFETPASDGPVEVSEASSPLQRPKPAETAKVCPKCNRENLPTAKFCAKCGSKF